MLERPLALALCAGIAATAAIASPYRGDIPSWWPRERIRIVYACPEGYVCFPAKDESRHVNSGLLPSRLVQTTAYRASDVPPAVQAQDTQRKKRQGRR